MPYHVWIRLEDEYGEFKVDLARSELIEIIVDPYKAGTPITIRGRIIPCENIRRILISETKEDSKSLLSKVIYKFQLQNLSKAEYVFKKGKDVTDEFIKGSSSQRGGESTAPEERKSQKVFVVHGHDDGMKQSVARTLGKLGLEPIILHEQPNKGRTIIEKLEDHSDVGSAVVLLSPDDFCYPKDSSSKDAKSRARQNVILELGFFMGMLGRGHVIALYREAEKFEMPSDYSGVIYMPYDTSNGWKLELVKELKASGYDVDANKL